MRGRVSTDDLIIFPRNRSELPAVSDGFPVISENQGFIEHHGRRLDRGGSRTGMMGSPRHGVSPLQAPVLVENSSAAGPLF